MSWTDERIDQLKTMWEKGLTASQIAEELGGVSRNAVIGKAHRLGLKSRPSPVKAGEAKAKQPKKAESPKQPKKAEAPEDDTPPFETKLPQPLFALHLRLRLHRHQSLRRHLFRQQNLTTRQMTTTPVSQTPSPCPNPSRSRASCRSAPAASCVRDPATSRRRFRRAPPRRLVPARPSAEIADKTSLLDLTDRICRWPMGHPGEPDFHFCGEQVNPGFPYCVEHCGRAYQAQLPRGTRRPPPPMPFGGPRVR